jgi:hypothetical protein
VYELERRAPPTAETVNGECGDCQPSPLINNNNLPSGAAQGPPRPRQPDRVEVRFRHAEQRRRRRPTITGLRVRELNIVRAKLYGETIPDTGKGRDLCKATAFHMAFHTDAAKRIPSWLDLRAPWLDDDDSAKITREAIGAVAKGIAPWSADKLGWHLKISIDDRAAWHLTTIGAVRDSKEKRKARRKAEDKAYQAAKRLAAGAKPRAKSAERTRPWAALGMSRATWHRHGKPTRSVLSETDSSAATLVLIRDDERVSPPQSKPLQVADRSRQEAAKGSPSARRGLAQCYPYERLDDLRSKRVAFADRPVCLTAPRITADDVPRLRCAQT